MTKQEFIQRLSVEFNDKKPQFLSGIRTEIASYIERQGKGCLSLIERRSSGNVLWKLSADVDYVQRLIAFCREKPINGNQLDSALTEPVVEIVTRKFEQLYENQSEIISASVLQYIVEDKILSQTLVNSIVDSSSIAGSAVRNRAASLIVDQLHHFMQTSTGHAVTSLVGKTIAATASKPVGMQIAKLLVQALGTQMKAIIAKVLASGAIKGTIAIAVKKFVIFAVAGTIVKAVAAKFGISAMAAFAWILIPVVVAYMAHAVYTFPKQLADKVSSKVVDDLSGKYSEVNDEVFDRVLNQVLETGIAVLVRPLADSAEVQDALGKLVHEI